MSDPRRGRARGRRGFSAQTNEPLLEYACHEGNIGLFGILSGARKQEADAALR